jgi:hypothetical protein
MRNILSWGGEDDSQIIHEDASIHAEGYHNIDKIEEDQANKQKRVVSFDQNQKIDNSGAKGKKNVSFSQSKKATGAASNVVKAQDRPRSASSAKKKPK